MTDDANDALAAKWKAERESKVAAYEDGDPKQATVHAAKAEAYLDAMETVEATATDADGVAMIRFADRHLDALVTGEKTVTVRYQFDRDLSPGETVACATEAGTPVVEARIVTTCELRADWVAFADFDGHQRYETTGDLLAELAGYYPEANLTPETILDVIVFETGVTP